LRQQLLLEPGRFALEEAPLPIPSPGDALVKVAAAGICGSDLHIYRDQSFIKPPIVLGHEFSGTVAAVGSAVRAVSVGQRVAVNPGINCGTCFYCSAGAANICERQLCIGACAEWPGAYADYVRLPAANLIPLPDSLSLEQAALIEPLAVAMRALDKAILSGQSRVVILGLGTIGQLVAQVCRARGAPCIITADPLPARRRLSEQLAADAALDPTDHAPSTIVTRWLGGIGADIVFDTASSAASFGMALALLQRGGRYVDVGEAVRPVEFDLNMLAFYEIELTGVNMHLTRNFDAALDALQSGAVRVEPLISAHYRLEDAPAAFAALMTDPGQFVKVLLSP
jgi:L-iditol 2-dehydrogenase